jgi:hypothetical protein
LCIAVANVPIAHAPQQGPQVHLLRQAILAGADIESMTYHVARHEGGIVEAPQRSLRRFVTHSTLSYAV